MQSLPIAVRTYIDKILEVEAGGGLSLNWTIPSLSKLVLIFSSTFSLIRGEENKTLMHFLLTLDFRVEKKIQC